MRPQVSQYPVQAPAPSLDSLHRDIDDLIARTKDDFVRDISNTELQTRLKALVDLQAVLRSQQLAPEALQAVRNQVRDLQMSQRSYMQAPPPVPAHTPMQNPMPSLPSHPPPFPYNTPVQTQYAPPPQSVHPQPTPEPQASQPPSTTTLATLLASVQRNMQSQPSNLPQTLPTNLTPQPPAPAPTPSSESPLFAQLRAAGLLKGDVNGDVAVNRTPPASNASLAPAQKPSVNLSDLLRQVATVPSKAINQDHVELNSASLKR